MSKEDNKSSYEIDYSLDRKPVKDKSSIKRNKKFATNVALTNDKNLEYSYLLRNNMELVSKKKNKKNVAISLKCMKNSEESIDTDNVLRKVRFNDEYYNKKLDEVVSIKSASS